MRFFAFRSLLYAFGLLHLLYYQYIHSYVTINNFLEVLLKRNLSEHGYSVPALKKAFCVLVVCWGEKSLSIVTITICGKKINIYFLLCIRRINALFLKTSHEKVITLVSYCVME